MQFGHEQALNAIETIYACYTQNLVWFSSSRTYPRRKRISRIEIQKAETNLQQIKQIFFLFSDFA